MPRRTAADAAVTREAIVAAARRVFSESGFADASLDAIAASAGVTRGAVHHHFTDKRALFVEVFERFEQELNEAVVRAARAAAPAQRMRAGVAALFAFFARPDYRQVGLADAPGVLGLERWYEIDRGVGMPTMRVGVEALADAGAIERSMVEPLTVLLFGALTEASLVLGGRLADVTEDEMLVAFERLIAGLGGADAPRSARSRREAARSS